MYIPAWPTFLFTQGGKYPFKEVIYCNLGDVQAMGHQPITYIRQLIAVCLNPGKYFKSGSDTTKANDSTRKIVNKLVKELSDELPSDVKQKLSEAVDGLSTATAERVGHVLDDIPYDVKERANILLNSLGGRSLGMCVSTWWNLSNLDTLSTNRVCPD